MWITEFSNSEFIHALLISKELLVNKITVASDRARMCPPRVRPTASSPWCLFLAAPTLGDVSRSSQCWSIASVWVTSVCSPCLGFGLRKRVWKLSTKPREIKYEQGLKIASVPTRTSHGCCKKRLFFLPVPFLIAVRAVSWEFISSSLSGSFQGCANKTWPRPVQLPPLSPESEKDQAYLTSHIFS